MSLRDFALAVAELLQRQNIEVVLTGGAVVAIYSNGKYVSNDVDFLSATSHQTIKVVMLEAGFRNLGKDFCHDDSQFTVEFPGTQLVIGEEAMQPEGEIKEGKFILRLLSPTQCVMDRLAAFYHWKDRQSLEQAVLVATSQPIKLSRLEKWSIAEGMKDRFEIFLAQLKDG